MKITAIPQLYRNLKRWREILAVLRRYGLADWLTQFQLPFRDALKDPGGVPLSKYTREQRVKMALTDLGPTFIKLGQVLAARPDLVGPSLAEELKSLRASVAADSIEQVRETLRQELGEDYEKHFTKIESRPLATASVGQVHKAKLKDGNAVVIKVLRSEIEPTVRQDMEVLTGLAQLAEHVDAFAVWRPSDMVRQLAPMITREIDFARERQNLEHFGELFDSHESGVLIPRAVRELCTRRVLVMEEITGTPLSDFLRDYKEQSSHQQQAFSDPTDQSSEQGAIDGSRANDSSSTKDRLAEKLADVYLAMIFDEGLFHADPHPGNLIVASDGRLGILDFGMVGRIDENLRESIEEMLIAISQSDQYRLTRLIRRIGDALWIWMSRFSRSMLPELAPLGVSDWVNLI